ncbi:TIGR02453 family protein [Amycolatopsis sp. NBRC 101858]|nr:TIGR02453 family protein [Amycolatopsis sp. NBRC 101858]
MPPFIVQCVKFSGFGEYAVDFYDGLVEDNSKPYWDDHVETYKTDVRAPMEALLAELAPEFSDGFGEPKVFRPYRDVRFAKDKTPYKTHCGAVVEQGRGGGAYYVEVGPEGLRAGGGCFHLAADQIARFRKAVDTELHGEALEKILKKLEKAGWEIRGDRLKSKPRGFDADHPRLDLLRYRSVYAVRVWEPDDVLHERGALDRVKKAWLQLREFNEWARDRVGPSELPRR